MRFSQQLKKLALVGAFATVAGALTLGPVTQTSASTTYAAPTNASRVAAGDGFLCMTAGSTTVYCSGLNDNGQLGDGTMTNRSSLTPIANDSKIKSPKGIAVGRAHACAIAGSMSDSPGSGTVYCWGDNTYGQLGNGTNTDSSSPVQVSNNGSFTNSNITGVIAGDDHTCAVMSTNKIFCWGLNDDGQVGDGTQVDKNVPTAVGGVFTSGTTQALDNWYPWVAAGARHTCAALAITNRIYCWGDNSSGQLGDGNGGTPGAKSSTPVDTGTAGGAGGIANTYKSPLAAGEDFTCSRDTSTLKCWGDNTAGQLGDGTNVRKLVPTAVATSTGLNQADAWSIAAGGQTACAISNTSGSSNYTVWCWGANNAGQVGDNTTTNRNTPTKVVDNSASGFDNESAAMKPSSLIPSPWGLTVARSVGDGFACVTMWCWGKNNAGQLAQGNTTDAALPVRVGIATVTADPATGVTASATLADAKVTLKFSGLPASAVTRVYYKITPQSFDLKIPRYGASYTDYQAVNLTGANVPTVTNNSVTVTISKMVLGTYSGGQPPTTVDETFAADGAYHVWFIVEGSATSSYPDGWVFRNLENPTYETLKVTGAAAATTTTAASTTTVAPTTTAAATTTTVAKNVYAAAKPGVTVTDTKVYSAPPVQVAASSSITMLTAAQNKVMDIVTQTPSVCLPNDDELVFINDGKCIAQVVNAKTRAVLKVLKTTVVEDDIADVKVGNAVVTLAPIYFDVMSSTLDATALARIKAIKAKVSAAGSVLVIGHSGTLNGNSPANVAIAKARALATVAALKSAGASGPFAISSVGALAPASTGKTETDQAKNRRAVIVLIP